MKKFTDIRKAYDRKIYEQEGANLPGNISQQFVTTQSTTEETGNTQSTTEVEQTETETTETTTEQPVAGQYYGPTNQPTIQVFPTVQTTGVVGVQPQAVQPQPEQPAVEQENQGASPGSVVSLFSKLFESREMAHIYHLQVNGEQGSHASHVALNEYYDSILDFIDTLVETYTGQYGIVDGYDVIDTKETRTKDKVEYFEGLVTFIKHARQAISVEDTHLHNIVDEIVALIYRTLYKLKFTK